MYFISQSKCDMEILSDPYPWAKAVWQFMGDICMRKWVYWRVLPCRQWRKCRTNLDCIFPTTGSECSSWRHTTVLLSFYYDSRHLDRSAPFIVFVHDWAISSSDSIPLLSSDSIPYGLAYFFFLLLPVLNIAFLEAKHNEGNVLLNWPWYFRKLSFL